MGFEVYLQCFKDGQKADISRRKISSLFAAFAKKVESHIWDVTYTRNNTCTLYLYRSSNKSRIEGFTVDRPCGDLRLWNALYELLCLKGVVLYYPGGPTPLVAHESTSGMLPADMIEAIGQPRMVRSGKEIRDDINDE